MQHVCSPESHSRFVLPLSVPTPKLFFSYVSSARTPCCTSSLTSVSTCEQFLNEAKSNFFPPRSIFPAARGSTETRGGDGPFRLLARHSCRIHAAVALKTFFFFEMDLNILRLSGGDDESSSHGLTFRRLHAWLGKV